MLLNIARRVSVVACSGWPAGLVVSVSSRRRMTSGATTNSSVDDAELKRFRKLANQWWIENGEFEALHRLNKLRVPMIRDAMINYRRTSLSTSGDDAPQAELTTPVLSVSEPLLGLNILDIGCGGGLLTEVRIDSLVCLCICSVKSGFVDAMQCGLNNSRWPD